MDKETKQRLDKQFDFIREIDKEKFIGRQTYLTGATRKEDDAEHAWHMAVMTILLSRYANEKIDVLKTITMLLIHDIVQNKCKHLQFPQNLMKFLYLSFHLMHLLNILLIHYYLLEPQPEVRL